MTLSYDYWKDREEKARQQTIKDEEERIKEIEEIYKRMFDEIQRDIDEFFAKYAADEGITIAEAKKRVSKLDMEEFERKAKEYVKNKDFSDQANEEMKLYNLTMKVNRLEMLKAKIGLELVDGYQEIEDYMGEALTETTMKEIERHAGILGKTVGDNQDYAEDIVDASFHNATWSERIWANQDRLKHDLGKLLTSGLIQGKNPRELARDLQKSMNVSKYDAERLMRTEMCRVQIDASLREIEANGFTQFIFIADSGGSRTCEQCKALDGKTFSLKDGKVGVNLPPLHPNCRCSIAGHEDDEDFISWLENHGVELTDDDLKAMGLSRKDVADRLKSDISSTDADNEAKKYNPALPDFLGLSDEKRKACEADLADLNAHMRNNKTEKSVVTGIDSNKRYVDVGTKVDEITLSKETMRYIKKAKPNSIIMMHCHPSDAAFSGHDIEKLGSNPSVKATIIECPSGKKYILDRGKYERKKGLFFYKEPPLEEKYDRILEQEINKSPNLVNYMEQKNAQITPELEEEFRLAVLQANKRLADENGLIFEEVT